MKVPAVESLKFQLSKETIKHLEKSTRCSIVELRTLATDEVVDLMLKRGAMKKPNKLKLWLIDKYTALGEKLGFLKKEYNFYTDID